MQERGRSGRYALGALFAALLLALGALAAACGGDDDGETAAEDTAAQATGEEGGGEGEPIRIGQLSNCEGPFAPFFDQTWGGGMLPLVNRGAEPNNPEKASEGVTNATIAGRPVDIVSGCSDSTPDVAVPEAPRLVEQENVDSLVGPLPAP